MPFPHKSLVGGLLKGPDLVITYGCQSPMAGYAPIGGSSSVVVAVEFSVSAPRFGDESTSAAFSLGLDSTLSGLHRAKRSFTQSGNSFA